MYILHGFPVKKIHAHSQGGNYMSVLVLFEAQVQPEKVAEMKAFLAAILPDTRAYDGCQAINVYFNTEDASNMVFVESWDSRLHYEKYLAWRTETGVMGKAGAMLAGPPTIRYFEKANV
jgi:quinol monooxygenase YgiN